MDLKQDFSRFIPKQKISGLISIVPEVNLVDYEKWLQNFFGKSEWPDINVVSEIEYEKESDSYVINCNLNLFLYFLRILNVPVFNFQSAIVIDKIKSASDLRYSCEVEFVKLDLFPDILEEIFRQAITVNKYILTNRLYETNVKYILGKIQRQIIDHHKKKIPGGKSTYPLLYCANKMNIPFLHLGRGIYQLGYGSKKHVFDRSYSELNSTFGTIMAQNKFVTTNYLRMAGLPAPRNHLVSNMRDARKSATLLGFPVVVKPIDRDRGEGVTVNINSEIELDDAFTKAIKVSNAKRVLVEEMISGVCHRLFIGNGALLYAVKRLPNGIFGDGLRSIRKIIQDEFETENSKAPWQRKILATLDYKAHQSLSRIGLNPESIPESGVFVPLRLIESTVDGGVDVDVTRQVNSENVNSALEISNLFGLREVGIDLITDDITLPWYQNGGAFNEINVAPLLGGGDISRSYIPKFLQSYFHDDGRIHVEVVEHFELARARQESLIKEGMRTFVISKESILGTSGNQIPSKVENLEDKVKSILLRIDCDAIVVC